MGSRLALCHGDGARAWLAGLVSDLESAAVVYGLELVGQVRLGREIAISFLVRMSDGQLAVLRAVEDRDVVRRQATVLSLWHDRPAVNLLAVDADRRILLIEALDPDRDLHSVDLGSATMIACAVASRLWLPARQSDRLSPILPVDLVAATGGIDPALMAEAQFAATRRDHAENPLVVLHGDLHRGNVLARSDERWIAIDPIPMIGPAAADLAMLASDLVADEVGIPGAHHRLAALVDQIVASVAGHGVSGIAVLDWMLLHRLHRISTAPREARDPAWDIEFAELIVSAIDSHLRRPQAARSRRPAP